MRKFYLLAFLGVLTNSIIAQTGISKKQYSPMATSKNGSSIKFNAEKNSNHYSLKGVVLWDDEFDVPSNWTTTNSSQPISWGWVLESDPTSIPENQTNAPELFPFSSTTVGNGFALIDSDGQPNNLDGNGAIVAEIRTATPIDLSGEPFVTLQFEHSYRWWQDTRGVRVSGDNGTTWTDYEITNQDGYPNDQNSGNPTIENIDISDVAGDSSEVLIEFYYNDNDIWAWYWAIDDVKIVRTDPNDLRNNGIYWGVLGAIGTRTPYYQIPVNQISAIDLSGSVSNIGYQDDNDVEYTVQVASEGFSSSSNIETVSAFATDTIVCNNQFTPPGLGSYTFESNVSSSAVDPTPLNNDYTMEGSIEVNNSIYARDMNIPEGRFLPEFEYEAGNLFDIFQDQDITGIDAHLSDELNVDGLEMFARLYSINENGEFVPIAESPIYSSEPGDEDGIFTFVFDEPVTLAAGEVYLAAVGSFTEGLAISISGDSPDQTTYIFGDFGDNGIDWYYSTSTPMVRMNFDPILNVNSEQSNEFKLNVYPNPAKDIANVDFTLENSSDVSLTLTDLSGKAVYSTSETMSAGKNTIAVPTDDLSNGIYMYTFSTGNKVVTKKLVINK